MTDLVAAMVQARLPWLSPHLRTWYDDARLEGQLAAALAVDADRVGDEEFGAQFRDGVGLEIGESLDWANRVVDLPAGGWAVCGVRYRGRDLARPFVDVVATTEPPSPDGLAVVADAVLPGFAVFEPLCLRVQAPDPAALVADLRSDARFGQACEIDMLVVAGLVQELVAAPRSPSYDRVVLSTGDVHTLAGRVAAIYTGLTKRNPALAQWATPEDEESLAECASENLLFEVLVDGDPAGVVAALREDAHAMSGFCVQEICLDAGHQGQRLASGVLQHLLGQLPAEDGDVLWGTIHPANTPSLRNSLSIGRRPVAGYVWVTPAGLRGMS